VTLFCFLNSGWASFSTTASLDLVLLFSSHDLLLYRYRTLPQAIHMRDFPAVTTAPDERRSYLRRSVNGAVSYGWANGLRKGFKGVRVTLPCFFGQLGRDQFLLSICFRLDSKLVGLW
jgi:hypothetical protein